MTVLMNNTDVDYCCWHKLRSSGSQPLMVCGPFLETLNTNGPLRGYKTFCPNDKPIEA